MASIKTVVELTDKEIRDIIADHAKQQIGGNHVGGSTVEYSREEKNGKTELTALVTFMRGSK